jgi:hypothetical protein
LEMLDEIVFCDEPDLSGILLSLVSFNSYLSLWRC